MIELKIASPLNIAQFLSLDLFQQPILRVYIKGKNGTIIKRSFDLFSELYPWYN